MTKTWGMHETSTSKTLTIVLYEKILAGKSTYDKSLAIHQILKLFHS